MTEPSANSEHSIVPASDAHALRVLVSEQLDHAISTAKAYSRDIPTCVKTIRSVALMNAESAEACYYKKPIGEGRSVTGGSVRFSELIASAWGNLYMYHPTVTVHERHVEVHAACHDLERNVIESGSAIKSIMYSKKGQRAGKRYTDDQIAVAISAAISVARRNARLLVVPRVIWEPILDECRQFGARNVKDIAKSVKEMLDYFGKLGVSTEAVLSHVGKASIDQIGAQDVADLRSTAVAIKNEELSIEEAFPSMKKADSEQQASGADAASMQREIRDTFMAWPTARQVSYLSNCNMKSIDEVAKVEDAEKLQSLVDALRN